MMLLLDESPLFSFRGRHCEEMGVAFLPTQYPLIPAQTIPTLTVSGRHGTLRFAGRVFQPRVYKGTLYLLGTDDEPISTEEMLRRASDIVLWLCGQDGRGQLILDALPDRYYWAEVGTEAVLRDTAWANGSIDLCFACQPYARSIRVDSAKATTTANAARSLTLTVSGNVGTVLAFHVTNQAAGVMQTLQIETPETAFAFDGLALARGETLHGHYTEDDILRLQIEGVDGATRSAMGMRLTSSDDDLIVQPGNCRVAVKTQTACSVSVEARGRWL